MSVESLLLERYNKPKPKIVDISENANSLILTYDNGTEKVINVAPRAVTVVEANTPKHYLDFYPIEAIDYQQGRLYWNTAEHTLDVCTGIDNVTLSIGQESYIRARNSTNNTLLNGSVVYVSGATGNRPKIEPAYATDIEIAKNTIGVATHDIVKNTDGVVTTFGIVRDINTHSFEEGDALYLGDAPGSITNVKPTYSTIVRIGTCLRSHPSLGSILVSIEVQRDNAIALLETKMQAVITALAGHGITVSY